MSHWPYPKILAHRGGGTLAPENTLGAIRLGARMGFAGVEIDVMLAGDGTPVLMHDHLCRELGLWANVEIKPVPGYERRTGDAVARMAAEHWRGAPLQPVLSSFSLLALAAARQAEPQLPRGLLVGRLPRHWREMLADLECIALHANHRALGARVVEEAHRAGVAVLAWTVNDRRVARKLLGWGVDCVVTDRLDRIAPGFA